MKSYEKKSAFTPKQLTISYLNLIRAKKIFTQQHTILFLSYNMDFVNLNMVNSALGQVHIHVQSFCIIKGCCCMLFTVQIGKE